MSGLDSLNPKTQLILKLATDLKEKIGASKVTLKRCEENGMETCKVLKNNL